MNAGIDSKLEISKMEDEQKLSDDEVLSQNAS